MLTLLFASVYQWIGRLIQQAQQVLKHWLTPHRSSQVLGMTQDLIRSRADLIAENALLRQQLIAVARQVKRPQFTPWDRVLMVWLSSRGRTWKQALLLIQPDTLLRWNGELHKWVWRRKSQHTGGKAPLASEVIRLIPQMATENPLWGAERIRGALLKLGFSISKSTIQKYLPSDRTAGSTQTWLTFIHNHAERIWTCDFIQVTDILFRSMFVFVIIELGSRRVVHLGVTHHPSEAWIAQQVREATPFGQSPRFVLRDNV